MQTLCVWMFMCAAFLQSWANITQTEGERAARSASVLYRKSTEKWGHTRTCMWRKHLLTICRSGTAHVGYTHTHIHKQGHEGGECREWGWQLSVSCCSRDEWAGWKLPSFIMEYGNKAASSPGVSGTARAGQRTKKEKERKVLYLPYKISFTQMKVREAERGTPKCRRHCRRVRVAWKCQNEHYRVYRTVKAFGPSSF